MELPSVKVTTKCPVTRDIREHPLTFSTLTSVEALLALAVMWPSDPFLATGFDLFYITLRPNNDQIYSDPG